MRGLPRRVEPRTVSLEIEYQSIPVTAFQQNCSLLWCTSTRRGVVVDPGGDIDRIEAAIEARGLEIEKILLTHAHLDHAGGAGVLAERLGVPIEGPHREDDFWLQAMPEQLQRFGLEPAPAFEPDRWLEHDDIVRFGDHELAVLHCPGHTPGHVVFHHPAGLAFVGDVLFAGSIGRTDFPRGNHGELIKSIRERLWPLGDEVVFVPGHGPESTFGRERATNPFVADVLFEGE